MNLYQLEKDGQHIMVAAINARNGINIIRTQLPEDNPLYGVQVCPCQLVLLEDANYTGSGETIVSVKDGVLYPIDGAIVIKAESEQKKQLTY